jgi:hypothetical protein
MEVMRMHGDLVPGYPAIPLRPLRDACRDWLGGIRTVTAFELERMGLLRLTRIDGKVFIAADDLMSLIESCREQRERAA